MIEDKISKLREKPSLNNECAYRFDPKAYFAPSEFYYTEALIADFKYGPSIFNDYQYYTQRFTKMPITTPFLIKENVLTQFLELTNKGNKNAIILLHGNSVLPDSYFRDDTYYLNNSATQLHTHGFDVYAPYLTHDTKFQNSRRRLASLKGGSFEHLDVLRVLNLFKEISNEYDEIHLAGISYGGLLAMLAFEKLLNDKNKDYIKKIGIVLSIEGFLPAALNLNSVSLFHPNYEVVFPGLSIEQLGKLTQNYDVFLGVGSCNRNYFDKVLPFLERKTVANNIIYFKGAHEFKASVFLRALDKR